MPDYPVSFAAIPTWAEANGVTVTEARIHFAQYAILCGVASVPRLQSALVFKGGNALDFVWQPNRSTIDLDFTLDPRDGLHPLDADMIKGQLERGLSMVSARLGVTFGVSKVRQDPPGADKTFATYRTGIGYALVDEVRLRQRLARGESSPHVVRIDISLNEPICEATVVQVDATHRLRVTTIEDIISEKLRALLQQPIRNRQRRQDLLDISVSLRTNRDLDHERIAVFLLRKAAARNVLVSRAAFRDPEVVRRAREDYDELEETARVLFVPFAEALALLHGFVDELAIPD